MPYALCLVPCAFVLQMLFPLVKALFPQSAEAVDSALDPQRHKGVDALNAKVWFS